MNAQLVERLACLEVRRSSRLPKRAGAFVQIHSSPAFGWHIAKTFARARVPFPVTALGRDHWLFKAYLMHLNPTDSFDPSVLEAYQLSRQPGVSAKLKALLMAGLGLPIDAHLNLVAEKTGIPRRTVEAWEILFFNILDRHQDGLYLSSLAYPFGRHVEFDEDYFKTTPLPDLLLRAAYNHRNFDLVSHLAGLDDASLVKELAALHDGGAEAKLENQIMGNALLIAKAGLINEQPSTGLQRATALLAAKRPQPDKANAAVAQNPYDTSGELAAALAAFPPITDADRQAMRAAFRPGLQVFCDEEGEIYIYCASDDTSGAINPAWPVEPSAPGIEWFPWPIHAVWNNKDSDKPVILRARMFEPGLPDYYLTDKDSGVPASEVFFDYQNADTGTAKMAS